MIWYKQGCVGDLKQPTRKCLGRIAKAIGDKYGDTFVTSIRDGNHMLGSLHYDGNAFDILTPKTTVGVNMPLKDIKEAAGPQFDVVREKDHVHVEHDPK